MVMFIALPMTAILAESNAASCPRSSFAEPQR
jgi:hypothetical protein